MRKVLIPACVLIVAALLLFVRLEPSTGEAPPFRLQAITGEKLSLQDCAGKVCILGVWATWCPSCIQEIPVFNELALAHPGELLIVGASVDDDPQRLGSFLKDNRLDYPVAMATSDFLRNYGFTGSLPLTVVLSPEGTIHARYRRPLPRTVFERDLEELLR